MKNVMSTIKLSRATKLRLSELGGHLDTYEDIIIRLLDDNGREAGK